MHEQSLEIGDQVTTELPCAACNRVFSSPKALQTHARYCKGPQSPATGAEKPLTGLLAPQKGINPSPKVRERKLEVPFAQRIRDKSGNCQVYLELLHNHAIGKLELEKGQLDSIRELLNRALGKSVTPAIVDVQSGEAVRLLVGTSDEDLEAMLSPLSDGAPDPAADEQE